MHWSLRKMKGLLLCLYCSFKIFSENLLTLLHSFSMINILVGLKEIGKVHPHKREEKEKSRGRFHRELLFW